MLFDLAGRDTCMVSTPFPGRQNWFLRCAPDFLPDFLREMCLVALT